MRSARSGRRWTWWRPWPRSGASSKPRSWPRAPGSSAARLPSRSALWGRGWWREISSIPRPVCRRSPSQARWWSGDDPRASDAAIAYSDAGVHELRGREDAMQLWRALRVTAGRAGSLKSEGIEPPFVGRERELRLVKEHLHASADERKAHLVSVIGIAGIGKSRLAWELYKYVDGVEQTRPVASGPLSCLWGRRRVLGTGGDGPDAGRDRRGRGEPSRPQRSSRDARAPRRGPEERAWIEPRLAHLLGARRAEDRSSFRICSPAGGSSSSASPSATRLYSSSRTCNGPTRRSSSSSITCSSGRAATRSSSSLSPGRSSRIETRSGRRAAELDVALARAALALGHGGAARRLRPRPTRGSARPDSRFARRAFRSTRSRPCECSWTAVCSSRRGRVSARPARSTHSKCPRPSTALIAARLDGLAAGERTLLQHASVSGKTFTKRGARCGRRSRPSGARRRCSRRSCARRSSRCRRIRALPSAASTASSRICCARSPTRPSRESSERRCTLPPRSTSSRSGSTATRTSSRSSPPTTSRARARSEGADAGEIRAKALATLTRAGERAASLAASESAQRYFEQALELTDDRGNGGGLHEHAGRMAMRLGAGPPRHVSTSSMRSRATNRSVVHWRRTCLREARGAHMDAGGQHRAGGRRHGEVVRGARERGVELSSWRYSPFSSPGFSISAGAGGSNGAERARSGDRGGARASGGVSAGAHHEERVPCESGPSPGGPTSHPLRTRPRARTRPVGGRPSRVQQPRQSG